MFIVGGIIALKMLLFCSLLLQQLYEIQCVDIIKDEEAKYRGKLELRFDMFSTLNQTINITQEKPENFAMYICLAQRAHDNRSPYFLGENHKWTQRYQYSHAKFENSLDVLPHFCQRKEDYLYMRLNSVQPFRVKLESIPNNGISLILNLQNMSENYHSGLIARFVHTIQGMPQNTWSTLELENKLPEKSRERLIMRYRYACEENHFGSDCGHFCRPRDDLLGHYTCHPRTGAIVCMAGWGGPRCTEAQCKYGCVHGVCERPDECSCLDGWTGSTCNQCLAIPGCLHGRCLFNAHIADWEPFTCHCYPGWIGMLCNIDSQICNRTQNLCQNGGKCVNQAEPTGSRPVYACVCPSGFSGTHCEIADSKNDQDAHNTEAVFQFGKRNCSSLQGKNQKLCEATESMCDKCISERLNTLENAKLSNETHECIHCPMSIRPQKLFCAEGICFNGGKCVNQVDGFFCVCPPKFEGKRCESPTRACSNQSCANGGECLDSSTYFSCHCPFGWEGDYCRENVNECALIPKIHGRALCENGAGCRDLPGTYQCLCPPGWNGVHCETPSLDTESKQVNLSQRDSGNVVDAPFYKTPNSIVLSVSMFGLFIFFTICAIVSVLSLWCVWRSRYGKVFTTDTIDTSGNPSYTLHNNIRPGGETTSLRFEQPLDQVDCPTRIGNGAFAATNDDEKMIGIKNSLFCDIRETLISSSKFDYTVPRLHVPRFVQICQPYTHPDIFRMDLQTRRVESPPPPYDEFSKK